MINNEERRTEAIKSEQLQPTFQQHHRKGETGKPKPDAQFPQGGNGAEHKTQIGLMQPYGQALNHKNATVWKDGC